MKERVAVLFALLFTLGLAGTTPAAAVTAAPGAPMGVPLPPGIAPTASAFVPGQLLVEFRATETLQEMRATAGAAGASVLPGFKAMSTLSGNRLVLVKSATMTTADLTASFAGEPTVVRTSPNYLRRVAAAVPDDPGLIDQWGLFKVGALQAWERSAGAPEVSSGQVVMTVALGRRDAETPLWPSDATDYKWLRCTMAPGTYRVLVAGTTHDAAGNLWETAVCRRTLRVK